MANKRLLCDTFVALLCLGCLVPVHGITGFRTDNSVDPLSRQISFNQQGQILSDVQQHRFGFQDQLTQSQSQNSFSRPLLPINQPTTFGQNQQLFLQPTGFQQQASLISQPQILFQPPLGPNEPSFLPLPPSQQQSPSFFQQSQQINGHQIPILQTQSEIPKQQLAPQPPTQNSFLPTIPTQSPQSNKFNFQNNKISSQSIPTNAIPRQNHADIPFQPNLGTNPLFSSNQASQAQSLLEEQRKQDLERLKELQERQKIIQKHKQFLERQQQKQQQKVQKLHEEFTQKQKKKQDEIYATAQPETEFTLNTQSRPRGILPHEVSLFQKAIKQYEELHPTTPIITTTTTTTTQRPKSRPRQRAKPRSEINNPELYLQSTRQKLYKELKSVLQSDEESKQSSKDAVQQQVSPSKLQFLQRQDLLKQLKLAIAENAGDNAGKNFSSREIALPNGEKFEVIKTSDPNLIAKATPISADSSTLSHIISSPNQIRVLNQPKVSFEDISKGVLPPGTDFEVIKQSGNGKLEEIGKLPPNLGNEKKVTFVFIEEQNDGSYKVKGVRGNEKAESPAEDVDKILKRIKEGEIQLPPVSTRTSISSTTKSPLNSKDVKPTTYSRQTTFAQPTISTDAASIYDDFEATKINIPTTSPPNYYNSASPSSLSINHNGSPQPSQTVASTFDSTTPSSPTLYMASQARSNNERNSQNFFTQSSSTTVNGHQMYPSTTTNNQFSQNSDLTYSTAQETPQYSQTPSVASPTLSSYTDTISILPSSSTYYPSTNLIPRSTTPKSIPDTAGSQLAYSTSSTPGLIEILKENGLFATAKYLKQSGLDAILNETGPYTVFAPTDKAFRTLLIQLGGPDKAEEKFKENPRLLSGLLLHHVIPGAFEITSLQDEMTGVSLAGTQLRVNQYDMHDVEWNEIKVTTVNGARVIAEKQDIIIPQGIAHAVDRVMFPLPVGDIIQTLQADRERRFTNFLKALFSSGLSETLADSRTYTVFAPTDRAFASLKSDELQKLVADKDNAKDLVMRHIAPGTLFSAGMRYYQVRQSMDEEKPITLQKNAGRIKVNTGHVITHNIPATNGVIHAVDTLL